jgi:uncharacterized protein (UPF0210 family)
VKIRTITYGTNLEYPLRASKIRKIGRFLEKARAVFEEADISVQTVRLSSQPWSSYLASKKLSAKINYVKDLEKLCKENQIDFASIGTVQDPFHIRAIPEILSATSIVSGSVTIGNPKNGIDFLACQKTAKSILEISRCTKRGFGNFRFAGIASCPSDIPFFPASYHEGKTCFSIGVECSDLVAGAFCRARSLAKAEYYLKLVLEKRFRKIDRLAQNLGKRERVSFKGVDLSPAPSLVKDESLAYAFEKLKLGKFGGPGTLAISAILTRALKSMDVKKCGYSGLMLPVLEDYGLARRWSRGTIDIGIILACSSVCGTGLDCIPLPGNISTKELYAILLDVAALSIQLNKPLSARLFPVPGKKAGDMTDFKSHYLVDCRITSVKQ